MNLGKFVRTTHHEYNPEPLVAARNQLGHSVRKAAELMNVHFVTLSRIENGGDTTDDMLEKVCLFYGIPMASVAQNTTVKPEDSLVKNL